MRTKDIKTDGTLYATGTKFYREHALAEGYQLGCVRVLGWVNHVYGTGLSAFRLKGLLVEAVDPTSPDTAIEAKFNSVHADTQKPPNQGEDLGAIMEGHPLAGVIRPVDVLSTWDEYQTNRTQAIRERAQIKEARKAEAAKDVAVLEQVAGAFADAGQALPRILSEALDESRKDTTWGRGGGWARSEALDLARSIIAIRDHAVTTR